MTVTEAEWLESRAIASDRTFNYPLDMPAARRRVDGDLTSIGMIYRVRDDETREVETASYFLLSLPAKVKTIAAAVRGHWAIENTLHWSLDVTFSEDRSRVRKDHGPANVAMFRWLVLSIIKQDTMSKHSLRDKRLIAGWDVERLLQILHGFCGN